VQNLSHENEFVLDDTKLVGGTHFHMNGFTQTRFDTETLGNSEIAYWPRQTDKWLLGQVFVHYAFIPPLKCSTLILFFFN